VTADPTVFCDVVAGAHEAQSQRERNRGRELRGGILPTFVFPRQ